ncbi:helix-turn-helix transcriptional regulator [Paenibacillus aceti]|uniref:DeoR family transcriptional regulator n=1 Tax=Paenibacillus aceti TaxID=1820010 RepID=A0ABQ1VZ10_9BACL|nr:YafY family protein [Paenibacillus aceti]GGG06031.1 DeoR family transcriptional regulator [Paenibacillus aceti]
MSKITRLFEIVYILLDRRNVTAKELADYFEVSPRTIYRDLDILSEANIPIYTNKGKGGGICLLENYVLNKSLLSEQEQRDILSALQGMKATHYPELNQILDKMSGIFGLQQASWVEVDFTDWSDQKQGQFQLIKTAILERRRLSFDYYGSSNCARTSRIVEPQQLWFKAKTWYLKAYCLEKQGMRVFKLSRMKRLQLHDETFHRSNYELANDEQAPIDCTAQLPIVTVKLKLDQALSYRVYDEFEEEQVERSAEGDFIVTVSYPENEWVYGYILSFGTMAEVLEPPRLREIIKDKLQGMLENYS